jgi:hypothetical protein
VWARWYAEGFDAVFASVADPADPAGDAEVSILNALVRAGSVGEEALDVLGSLLAAAPGDRARSRASSIAETIANLPTGHRNGPLARRVVRMLAGHPLYTAQAVRAALDSARLAEDGVGAERVAEELAAVADHLPDRPALTARIADRRLGYALGGRSLRGEVGPARLLPAARLLAGRGDAASHLLAVAVVRRAGPAAEWPDAWRDLLTGLRDSPHLEVRQDAWDVALPEAARA